MKIRMETGLIQNSPQVEAVLQKARVLGLIPEVEFVQGTAHPLTEVALKDGERVKCASLPDYPFRSMRGVAEVVRITPPRVQLAHNAGAGHHRLELGPTAEIGTGLPCVLVFGPCTVDKHISSIVRSIDYTGKVKGIRGGCWKPRSSPYSFPGHGEQAVHWLLEAAAAAKNIEFVCIEVIESAHLEIIRRAQKATRCNKRIVVWVGARTRNSELLLALGKQREFPVMLKNSLDATNIQSFADTAEWILGGSQAWSDEGTPTHPRAAGNDQLIFCLRGLRQTDDASPWRFRPNNDWVEGLTRKFWAPVCVDPSHSAGNLDLLWTGMEDALVHKPSMLMVEGGYPHAGLPLGGKQQRGLCDADQSLPIEDLYRLTDMITLHNKKHYR